MIQNNSQTNDISKLTWIFFGTSRLSVIVLDTLLRHGYLPSLIITSEDKPKGRKMILTPPDTKVWAEEHSVAYIQAPTLRDGALLETLREKFPHGVDFGVVASYGKIIPQNILDFPTRGMLNVHPSLLPRLRGASPIQSSILTETETGVTIIRLDAEMDHGPIVAQEKVAIADFPPYADELEHILAEKGGQMLVEVIPDWVAGTRSAVEQDHNQATLCTKIQKTDGEINLDDAPEKNLRKIRAYSPWPSAYFFVEKNGTRIRVIIKKAHLEDGVLVIDRVVPESKKEMDYATFQKSL